MLDKEEIKDFTLDWFDCEEEQAEAFAKDLYKHQMTKTFLIDWLPNLVLIVLWILYLIYHR